MICEHRKSAPHFKQSIFTIEKKKQEARNDAGQKIEYLPPSLGRYTTTGQVFRTLAERKSKTNEETALANWSCVRSCSSGADLYL